MSYNTRRLQRCEAEPYRQGDSHHHHRHAWDEYIPPPDYPMDDDENPSDVKMSSRGSGGEKQCHPSKEVQQQRHVTTKSPLRAYCGHITSYTADEHQKSGCYDSKGRNSEKYEHGGHQNRHQCDHDDSHRSQTTSHSGHGNHHRVRQGEHSQGDRVSQGHTMGHDGNSKKPAVVHSSKTATVDHDSSVQPHRTRHDHHDNNLQKHNHPVRDDHHGDSFKIEHGRHNFQGSGDHHGRRAVPDSYERHGIICDKKHEDHILKASVQTEPSQRRHSHGSKPGGPPALSLFGTDNLKLSDSTKNKGVHSPPHSADGVIVMMQHKQELTPPHSADGTFVLHRGEHRGVPSSAQSRVPALESGSKLIGMPGALKSPNVQKLQFDIIQEMQQKLRLSGEPATVKTEDNIYCSIDDADLLKTTPQTAHPKMTTPSLPSQVLHANNTGQSRSPAVVHQNSSKVEISGQVYENPESEIYQDNAVANNDNIYQNNDMCDDPTSTIYQNDPLPVGAKAILGQKKNSRDISSRGGLKEMIENLEKDIKAGAAALKKTPGGLSNLP